MEGGGWYEGAGMEGAGMRGAGMNYAIVTRFKSSHFVMNGSKAKLKL